MPSEDHPLEGRIVLPYDGSCCRAGEGDSSHVHICLNCGRPTDQHSIESPPGLGHPCVYVAGGEVPF